MKRVVVAAVVLLQLLTGCTDLDSDLDRAMALRQKLQQNACSFEAEVTADYSDALYTFKMLCEADVNGDLTFTVMEPETIAGISGLIDQSGGKLTFDDTVLAFKLLADEQISPVSAPWILLRTLRSGYIQAASGTESGLKLIINDSYEEDSLQLDIWLDGNDQPEEAEILFGGRRILSIKLSEFAFL